MSAMPLTASSPRFDHGFLRRSTLMEGPVFFPSRTNHIRMFPTKHAFSYSYLLMGIPIGWKGSIGSILSVDLQSQKEQEDEPQPQTKTSRTWFSAEAEHYLDRGDIQAGFQGRLRAYLQSQVSSPVRRLQRTCKNGRAEEFLECLTGHLSLRLPRHCSALSGASLQPSLFLVPLRSDEKAKGYDRRSQ